MYWSCLGSFSNALTTLNCLYKDQSAFIILLRHTENRCPSDFIQSVSLSSYLPLYIPPPASKATGSIVLLKREKTAPLLFIPLWKLLPLLPALSRINSASPEQIDGRQARNNVLSQFGEKNLFVLRVPWKPCSLPNQLRLASTPRHPPACEGSRKMLLKRQFIRQTQEISISLPHELRDVTHSVQTISASCNKYWSKVWFFFYSFERSVLMLKMQLWSRE